MVKKQANARLYYQLVEVLQKLEAEGDDPKKVVDLALKRMDHKRYSYDRGPQWRSKRHTG